LENESPPEVVDLDPEKALAKLDAWLDGATRLLPNIVVAFVLILIVWFLAKGIERAINHTASRQNRNNLGEVLGSLIRWAVFCLGFLVAMTIVIPSLKPADLIAGMGIGSVAIGFAFKDILQNWLAGLLILFRQPFRVGDAIKVGGYEGTVEHIESRATILKSYDGQRYVIPNSDLYTDTVTVITAYENRRNQYDFGIGYDDDAEQAIDVIRGVIARVSGVLQDPAPQAFVWGLDASWVTIRARWWTASQGPDYLQAYVTILAEVKKALDAKGIDMPFETQMHLVQKPASAGDQQAPLETAQGS
jgi:small-conductance mechanosensitive channel